MTLASRTDFDLRKHAETPGEDFRYHDLLRNERKIYSILYRCVTLAFLCDAYDEEGVEGSKDARTVLHFHPALAPYKKQRFYL